MRNIRGNIQSLRMATQVIMLMDGQYFCETEKSYEIWSGNPPVMIKRISKKYIFWVEEYDK